MELEVSCSKPVTELVQIECGLQTINLSCQRNINFFFKIWMVIVKRKELIKTNEEIYMVNAKNGWKQSQKKINSCTMVRVRSY